MSGGCNTIQVKLISFTFKVRAQEKVQLLNYWVASGIVVHTYELRSMTFTNICNTLRVHVSQADGRLLLLDVQALGLFAGDRNCGYSSCN